MDDEYSYKDEDDLRELYAKYQTLQDIANQFDVTSGTINYYFDKYDIETNDKHSTVRERDTPETELEPNTECDYCGKEIHKKPCHIENHEYQFCNRECYNQAQSEYEKYDEAIVHSGENHVQYNRVEVECNNCGSELQVTPSRYEDRDYYFCDADCYKKYDGEIRDRNVDLVTVVCEWCNEEYDVHPYRTERTRFCSNDCKDEWMGANHCGENHPQYQGGDMYYGEDWFTIRDEIRDRDGGVCRYCGTEQNELNQKHDVHHIIPAREFDEINDAHYDENLVQLCRGCHRTVETLSVEEQKEEFGVNP